MPSNRNKNAKDFSRQSPSIRAPRFGPLHEVIIVFERKKGFRSAIVHAGLFLVAGALLSACGEQPVPVDSQPSRVAATSAAAQSDNADRAEVPEIVVTASRTSESET